MLLLGCCTSKGLDTSGAENLLHSILDNSDYRRMFSKNVLSSHSLHLVDLVLPAWDHWKHASSVFYMQL